MSQLPSVGRRMWIQLSAEVLDDFNFVRLSGQPFDAGVIHVNGDTTVNLQVTDHEGINAPILNVPVWQGDCEQEPVPFNHAYWMPYQKKQHQKQHVL